MEPDPLTEWGRKATGQMESSKTKRVESPGWLSHGASCEGGHEAKVQETLHMPARECRQTGGESRRVLWQKTNCDV